MKKYFDLARAGGVLLVAVFALFVFSCSEKPESQPVDTGCEVKVALAEAAGKAHNRALDILLQKLKAAEQSATTRNEEEPLYPIPEPPYVTELMVEAIVQSVKEMSLGLANSDSVYNELAYYMAYCEQNPDAEPQLIPWSYGAEYCLNDAVNIIRKINNNANVDALIDEIKQLEQRAFALMSKNQCLTFLIGTSIMCSSLRYWHDNFSTWFSWESYSRWGDVARADCEWAIGIIKGDNKFRNSTWMTNVMGALSYGARQIFTCACATAGSMNAAMSKYLNPEVGPDGEVEDFGDLPDIEDELQYDYCYTIANSALHYLSSLPFDWDDDTPGEAVPGD